MEITGAGDVVDGPTGSGDGLGTVTFSRAPSSTNSLAISQVITSGQPNGTLYRICIGAPVEKIDFTKKDSDFCQGNPIMPGTGNKIQVDTDYVGTGAFSLRYARTYNSVASLGAGWRNSYERSVRVVASSTLTATRADGKA